MELEKKKGKINQVLIIVFGLLILTGSILTYLFILRGIYGAFDNSYLLPDKNVVKALGSKKKIAVLYSKYTENMLSAGSSWLNDNITTWERFLSSSKLNYKIINDNFLEEGKHFDYDILILPGSKSLSDLEIMQIKKYIINGGSIFATSGTASYSDNGKWRGWEFFSEVFGLRFTKEISSNELTKNHTIRGSLPITSNIPTGFPLKIATWDRPMACEVLDPRTTQASFWYDYKFEPGLVREEVRKSAGIVSGTYGKGRFVWMGFEINLIIGIQEDYIYFDRLFRNCINWLSYGPVAYIKEWPAGYNAAAVLTPVLTDRIENISNLLELLRSEKINATFFVDPLFAKKNINIVQQVSNLGEVAALIDIGYLSSVNDTENKLNDLYTQTEKLRRAKTYLESITHSKIIGCLPFYSLYDQNTITALNHALYKYILTDSLSDRSVPKPMIFENKMVTVLTKNVRDDYEVIRDFNLNNPEYQFYTYQEDIDRILFEGGMYIFKIHPEYQCRPENINVIRQIIQDLKSKKYWITTASEIENWSSRRYYLETRVDRRGETRVSVTISNAGVQTASGLILFVDLNENAEKISLTSEIIGTKVARYVHETGSKSLNLFIDDLKPSESRTYYIDYEKTKITEGNQIF